MYFGCERAHAPSASLHPVWDVPLSAGEPKRREKLLSGYLKQPSWHARILIPCVLQYALISSLGMRCFSAMSNACSQVMTFAIFSPANAFSIVFSSMVPERCTLIRHSVSETVTKARNASRGLFVDNGIMNNHEGSADQLPRGCSGM